MLGVLILLAVVTSYYAYDMYLKSDPINNEEEEKTIIQGPEAGNLFIDLEFPLITGDSLKISDLKGDLIILNLMTPQCPGCRLQLTVLEQLTGNEDVSIVTINLDPRYDMSLLRRIAADAGITWFFGHLPEAALEYQVSTVPVVVFIDRNGIIKYRGGVTTLGSLEQLIELYK
jgi:cytochrome oxidase Cu insertion factor (SCO1/SenC/PrrC family)